MIGNRDEFDRHPPAGFDGVTDWEWMARGCPGKIRPMDIDSCIEINGRFLMTETKATGAEIPRGQWLTIKRLVLTGYVTFLLVHPKEGSERYLEIVYLKNGSVKIEDCGKTTEEELEERTRKWCADMRKKTPPRYPENPI